MTTGASGPKQSELARDDVERGHGDAGTARRQATLPNQFLDGMQSGAFANATLDHQRSPESLVSSFGLGVDFIVMALAPVLWLLFLGRAVSGVCAATGCTSKGLK